MIRVALIGCGKMAEQHAVNIGKIPETQIVGVCDRELLMAQQLSEHFKVPKFFTEADELLEEAQPQVVHITTPPQSHFELGLLCLKRGCHVLVEKPFTLHAQQAKELISEANSRSLKITVGHNAQFSHAAIRLRRLVKNGFLGSRVVHMENVFCYDLGNKAYARAFLGDSRHWVHKLPGKLLHNIISHGIGQIAEFLDDETPEVIAQGQTSQFLQSLGENEIIDELRVIIRDRNQTTAFFNFSSQMCPKLHQFRIFGDRNGLILDDDNQTVIRVTGMSYPSFMNQFVPPLRLAGQYLRNTAGNLFKFLRGDFHVDARTRILIDSFYRAVEEGTPLPISQQEIMTTANVMDEIFRQLAEQRNRLREIAYATQT